MRRACACRNCQPSAACRGRVPPGGAPAGSRSFNTGEASNVLGRRIVVTDSVLVPSPLLDMTCQTHRLAGPFSNFTQTQ